MGAVPGKNFDLCIISTYAYRFVMAAYFCQIVFYLSGKESLPII